MTNLVLWAQVCQFTKDWLKNCVKYFPAYILDMCRIHNNQFKCIYWKAFSVKYCIIYSLIYSEEGDRFLVQIPVNEHVTSMFQDFVHFIFHLFFLCQFQFSDFRDSIYFNFGSKYLQHKKYKKLSEICKIVREGIIYNLIKSYALVWLLKLFC